MMSLQKSQKQPELGRFSAVALAGFAVLGWFLNMRVLGGFFQSDDFEILAAVSRQLKGEWFAHGFFRPLTNLSYYFDYRFWELAPSGYRLLNLILHIFTAYFVYLLAERLFRKAGGSLNAARWSAVVSGLWFLVFPGHAEATAWISGRADLMAACFGLMSLYFYLRYRGEGGGWKLGIALGALTAGVFSKESVLTLPVIWWIWDWTRRHDENSPRRFWPGWPVVAAFGVLAGYVCIRFWSLGELGGGYAGHPPDPAWMLDAGRKFLLRCFFPATAFHYFLLKWKADLVLGAVFFYLAWRQRKQGLPTFPAFSALWASLAVSLLPVLNLDIALETGFSERFIYFPSAFAALLAGWAFSALYRFRRIRWAALIFLPVLLGQGALYWRVNQDWRNAADLSKSILSSYAALAEVSADAGGRVFIVTLPDSLRGCYIYRMGFQDAARIFYGTDRTVVGVATCELANRDAGARLSGRGPGVYQLELDNAQLVQQPAPSRLPFYRVRQYGREQLTLRFTRKYAGVTPLYYSNGVLRRYGANAASN